MGWDGKTCFGATRTLLGPMKHGRPLPKKMGVRKPWSLKLRRGRPPRKGRQGRPPPAPETNQNQPEPTRNQSEPTRSHGWMVGRSNGRTDNWTVGRSDGRLSDGRTVSVSFAVRIGFLLVITLLYLPSNCENVCLTQDACLIDNV